jgi:UPF0716 protein FxsA
MQWVFLLFPFVELWTLIELGDAIGPFLAIVWVFLGIVIGLAMIRRQGLSMIRQIQRDSETGLITPRFLNDDLAVVTSGLLLMIPGLVTDCLALLVLVGPLRRLLTRFLPVQTRSSVHVRMYTRHPSGSRGRDADPEQDNVTVEGDYRRLDD